MNCKIEASGFWWVIPTLHCYCLTFLSMRPSCRFHWIVQTVCMHMKHNSMQWIAEVLPESRTAKSHSAHTCRIVAIFGTRTLQSIIMVWFYRWNFCNPPSVQSFIIVHTERKSIIWYTQSEIIISRLSASVYVGMPYAICIALSYSEWLVIYALRAHPLLEIVCGVFFEGSDLPLVGETLESKTFGPLCQRTSQTCKPIAGLKELFEALKPGLLLLETWGQGLL